MIDHLYGEAKRAYDSQRFAEALALLRQAQMIAGDDPAILVQQAQSLYFLCRAPEAIEIMRPLFETNAGYAALLALYVRAVGDFEESARLLALVDDITPGAAFLKGWDLLRQGRFLEGMRVREREPGIYRADALLPLPLHKKYIPGMSIAGKTILLALEGGNGDEIAYARFAQVLAERGARVIAGTTSGLVGAIGRMPGVALAQPTETVHPEQYDLYIPAMSMISLFEINDPSAGIVFPYLVADEAQVPPLRSVIEAAAGGRKKIGIQWRGNSQFDYSEFKTFPATLLVPFAQLGRPFSLQVQDQVGENRLPDLANAHDLQNEKPSWERTIAAIDQMDCVIAGDTTIAHIAGALGIPTALLLPHAPHPYWADLKERSTWYPSIRVFRQPKYNDWEGSAQNAFEWMAGDF